MNMSSVSNASADVLHVTAVTAYPQIAPAPRVRLENWRPFLASHGVVLHYEPALRDDEYVLLTSPASPARKLLVLGRAAARVGKRSQRDGLLLVHRLRFPAPLPAIDSRGLDVYDFDDAIFLGSMMHANRRYSWVKREAERSVAHMRSARLVIAGNSYLASMASKLNSRVEVVPSCIDTEGIAQRKHAETEMLTVGWLGSASTSRYLRAFMPLWQEFRASQSNGARLLLVGADRSLAGPGVEHRAWSFESERAALAEIDIGVMPMPDDPWTRGKCGYKLMQYFSAGIPAVAAPVGVNARVLASGGGLSAVSPREWLSHLRELGSSQDMRAEMGRTGRSFVEREYSYSVWAPRLADMLGDL